jgi:hypothetical protein
LAGDPVPLACKALKVAAAGELTGLFPQILAWLFAEGAGIQPAVEALTSRLLASPKLAACDGGPLAAAALAVLWCEFVT